jgi:excisionase family DNA binding protein
VAKKSPKKHVLLDGRVLDLGELDGRQRAFLADLDKMERQGVSYFEIYRAALGPGSPALQGRSRVDRKLAEAALYRTAQDIATRAGIAQGLILAPDHEAERMKAPTDSSMISVTQAAALIGITRAAVYKAIEKKTLPALRVGNVTVVARAAAVAYRDGRVQEAVPEPRAVAKKTRRYEPALHT